MSKTLGPEAPLFHQGSSLPSHPTENPRPLSTRQLPWVEVDRPSGGSRKLLAPKEALWFPTLAEQGLMLRGRGGSRMQAALR